MKVIVTGSSGMVGKAVLLECLEHPKVEQVLIINRSPINLNHSKIKEVILSDFSKINSIEEQLKGFDACFHCMGISAVGLSEENYSKVTYKYTKNLVDVLYNNNPEMVFNYVSGSGTDSSEKGNIMWARVKGKTENYILNKGFKDAYAFRPGAIIPQKGVKSKTKIYNLLYIITKPLYPLLMKFDSITSSSNVGIAMINSVLFPQSNKHLENKDINQLAKNKR